MKIGVIKDPKQGEARVGMTPENVKILVEAGNEVLVDSNAGAGCGFTNDLYEAAGGQIVDTETAWEAELIVKVKEPMESEYKYFKPGQIIWGFLHLAANKACVEKMMEVGVTAISGENISINGVLELLKPMSAIAGRRAVNIGQYYLEKQHEGEGILLVLKVSRLVQLLSSVEVMLQKMLPIWLLLWDVRLLSLNLVMRVSPNLKNAMQEKQLKSLNQQQKHWKKILNLQMSLSQQS